MRRGTSSRRPRKYLELRRFNEDERAQRARLFWVTFSFVIMVFSLILFRLFDTQVLHYKTYKEAAENNRFRSVRIPPLRGGIYDATGRVLAGIRPSFDLIFYRDRGFKEQTEVLARLSNLAGMSLPVLQAKVIQASKDGVPRYIPVVLARDLDWTTLSRVVSELHRLPGVDVEVSPRREYPQGNIAAHLIGYIDEVSLKDLKSEEFIGARPGDLVGKSGIERVYEKELRGIPGSRLVEIDAKGRLIRLVETAPPKPGQDLYLTVDSRIQRAAISAMDKEVGAVVALDPRDGRVLSLVSTPGFDPEVFLRPLSQDVWSKLNDPKTHPLLNKAIQDVYPPGSVFKVVMALGGLQGGFITSDTTFLCNSYFRLGRRVFRCWDWRGHGKTDLYKALVESCDVYFYNLGLKMGIDNISRYARLFGLGDYTGIRLPGERKGIVPTRQWKLERFKEPWQKGETLNTSIGQGFLSVTPIQAAVLVSAVANEGTIYVPTYVEEIRDHKGGILWRFSPVVKSKVPISRAHFRKVKRAMLGVVQDEKGTARACRIPGLEIGGKTGTAQVVKQKKRIRSEKLPWDQRDHAWFVAFAPVSDPKIAVAVFVEHGGHGGSVAAPIARQVIEAWKRTQLPTPSISPGRVL